ncbi:DUF4864 domain-containing protein [Pseudohoeflea suaedae]|uniref:DUF4864 domain-containing protein n=1 Tax=Pseudohoeflea suaedae TaxID=877384 RepID=A0A4R5PQ90_9HYPH|nr:DUF4864 domain-containing protein [Pseudohoeflea suaedae]TDH39292.1 DUF4864 domain-containing protein [Pseudohoeflea suaedae]
MPRLPELRRLALSILLIAPLHAAPARAQEPVEMSQTVIESQIKSFLRGDIEGAYALAAPSIRQIFPTVEKFGAMVRSGYGPVYRPGNYAFGRSRETAGGGVIQEVLIAGPDGQDYTAIYDMERQPDGTMKIRGVSLIRQALPQT